MKNIGDMKQFKKVLQKAIDLLPDEWKAQRVITVLADQELFASYNSQDGLKVKVVRCNFCGECCLDVPDDHLSFGTNGEGKCNKLIMDEEGWKCGAGYEKPFSCLGDPSDPDYNCCIRYV